VQLKIILFIAQTYTVWANLYTNFGPLSEYLYELYHFYYVDPSNFNSSLRFIMEFIFFS